MKPLRCLALVLGAACAFGARPETNAPTIFHYEARVMDANGQPLPGAVVELYRGPDSPLGDDTTQRLDGRCPANASGAVTFTVTNQSVFMLVARKPGLSLDWTMWFPRPDPEQDVQEFTLTAPTSVSGIVQDASGKPIADATVWVGPAYRPVKRGVSRQSWNYLSSQLGRELLASRTSADGRFRIEGLPADATLEIDAAKAGLAPDQPARAYLGPTSLGFQAGQTNIVVTLKPAGVVEGRVVHEGTDTPVAGARVTMSEIGVAAATRSPSLTGPDGSFRLADLSAGEHTLRALIGTNRFADWVCEPVTVTVESGSTNRDVRITASRGGVLEVAVRDESSGRPVHRASVSAYRETQGNADFTSEQGIARIRLLPGEYQLFVNKDGQRSYQSRATVEFGQTNQLDITLAAAPRIDGTVLGPDGKPAPKVTVTVFPFHQGEKKTDAEGRFTLVSDPNQFGGMQQHQSVIIARDPARNLAATLDMDEETTNAVLRLEAALTLAGLVMDAKGQPISTAEVQVMLQTERMSSPLGSGVRVESDGRFEIKGLPNEHRYIVSVSARGFGGDNRNVDMPDAATRRVELDPFSLPLADQRIAGIVVDADDKPVAGAQVYSHGQKQPRGIGRTDDKGRFSIDQVCAGPVQLSASTPRGRGHGSITAEGGETNVVLRLGVTQSYSSSGGASKLSGTVTDPDDKPAARVLVTLFPFHGTDTQTDSAGCFKLSYNPNEWGGPEEQPRVLIARDLARDLATALDLEQDATNAVLRLEPCLTLVGRVTDAGGKPITNAQAQVMFYAERMGSSLGTPIRADTEGRFEIKGLPPGRRYGVNVSAKGFGQANRSVETADDQTRRVELDPFQLIVADQRIAGVVLDADDKPVAGAWVNSHGENQPPCNGQTDAKGRFSFDKVCPGPIQIYANTQRGQFGRAATEGGDTNITIRVSSSSGARFEGPRRPSLKGKPLPDLTILGLAADAVPAGKPILVCLFDHDQRPSRRSVRLLSEQNDALAQRGITLLGVQAAIETAESWKEWKDANPVRFAVGRVAAKSDKTKWASEVESLPWLILTDSQGRVVAEGFALDELDAKLTALAK